MVEHGDALLDVVGLVEDELVRAAELPEADEPAEDGDDERAEPAPEDVGGPEPEQPCAQLLPAIHGDIVGEPRQAPRALLG